MAKKRSSKSRKISRHNTKKVRVKKNSTKKTSKLMSVKIVKPVEPSVAYITIGHMNAMRSNSYMVRVFALIGIMFSGYLGYQYYSGSAISALIVFSFIFLLNLFTHKNHKAVVRMTFYASLVVLIMSVSVTLISAQFISVTLIALSFLILLFSIANLKYGRYRKML